MRTYINFGFIALFFLASFQTACTQQAGVDQVPGVDELVEVDTPPNPLNMADVQRAVGYPQKARDQGIEGMVVARILVDEEGNYVRHEWAKGEPQILAEAVDEEIAKLTFTPAEKEGKPVKFWVNLPFKFKLLSGEEADVQPKPVNLVEVYQQIVYPESMKEQGLDGKVIVKIKVGVDGEYLEHEVVQADHEELVSAVEAVVDQLQYEPAEKDGEAVNAWVVLPFTFKLPA